MDISFSGGKFVSGDGELNYQEVLDDFSKAKVIRIITYNISKQRRLSDLLDQLKYSDADIQFITNVPSRMKTYYNSPRGNYMRSTAHENINIYISRLNPSLFSKTFTPYFNVNNHAKIVGTENVVYIGSANYSSESAQNIEAGVIIRDKNFIQQLYSEFFESVKSSSLSYFDPNFSAFHLFIVSLLAKFQHHYKRMLQDLFTDYERTKLDVADTVFIDKDELDVLYLDLEELESLDIEADNTYDEDNEQYNTELECLKRQFEAVDISWLKETISYGGTLYNLVTYDVQSAANTILQEQYSAVAFDENLDFYADKSIQQAAETYSDLRYQFSDDADCFIDQFNKILNALDSANQFACRWKPYKINSEVDNTMETS